MVLRWIWKLVSRYSHVWNTIENVKKSCLNNSLINSIFNVKKHWFFSLLQFNLVFDIFISQSETLDATNKTWRDVKTACYFHICEDPVLLHVSRLKIPVFLKNKKGILMTFKLTFISLKTTIIQVLFSASFFITP